MANISKFLRAHWQQAVSVILGLCAFCYWYLLCPHVLAGREQTQLFLWDWPYLFSRLAQPGGLARYLGECLTQFFYLVPLGALVVSLLIVAVQRLSLKLFFRCGVSFRRLAVLLSLLPALLVWWLLMQTNVPMTLPVALTLQLWLLDVLSAHFKASRIKLFTLLISLLIPIAYWLLGPVAILLALLPLFHTSQGSLLSLCLSLLFAACVVGSSYLVPYPLKQLARGIDYYWPDAHHFGTTEEMHYDLLLRQQNWPALVRLAKKTPPPSRACDNALRLALYHTGQLPEEELNACLVESQRVLSSQVSAFIMSEVYMNMGMVNMAQRAAFEAMESISNYNKSARALRRLTETAVVTGQNEVARKYISILSKTLFYRGWAQRMLPLVDHPEQLDRHPYYGKLRRMYAQTSDVFFI